MAKRIIPIEVRDEYILGAGRVIGAKGSHDDVALRVEFNEMWHGKSITAVWLNAVGESPVVAPINFSNWEGSNPLICIIDIPAKAKSAVGDAMLTIRGFTSVDGETESTATLTATAYFKVLESDFDNEAEEEEEEDKLNLYQKLQSDITALSAKMSNAIDARDEALNLRDETKGYRDESENHMEAAAISAGAAAGSANTAAGSASNASDFADEAGNYANAAKSWAVGGVYQGDDTNNAKYWNSKAEKAQAAAEAAQEAAGIAKGEAQTAKGEAIAAKNEAQTAYTNANGEYKKAVEEAGKAAASATAAKSSADTAAEDAAAKAAGNVEGRLVGYVTQASGEVAKAEGEVVKAAASAQTASDKAVAAARSASSAESSAAAAAQSATQAANVVSGLKDTAAYLEDHLGEVADAEAAKLQMVADSVNEAVELAAVYKDDAWMAAERAEDAADRAEAAGGVSKGYVDEELEKKLDKTGGTITDGEYDTALEAGEIIVTNGFASAKVGCGGIDIALDSEGKDESVIIRKNKIEFSHTYEDDETGETVSKAKGIVRGLANATDDSDAVPYGQMVEYVAANGGGVSEEYVNEELAKKLDKTGGTMSDEEGISETTLSPYGVEIEDIDLRSQAKFDISGVHFTVSTDEGKVAGGGRISGLVDATLDHEAVTLGQLKRNYHTLLSGEELPADANFNLYSTRTGVYYFKGDTTSLNNKPAGLTAPFKLTVSRVSGLSDRVQEILEVETGIRYCRYGYGLIAVTWGKWTKSYNTANKPTPEEIGALPQEGGTVEGDIVFDGGKIKGLETAAADDEAVPFGQMKKYVAENGGGGGGVSSWNDLTDRPFYSGTSVVDLLPETTVEFDPNTGEGYLLDVVDARAGNTCTVKWNGTEYTCVAQPFDMDGVTLVALGNLGAMTGDNPTEEPFLVMCLDANTAAAMGTGGMVYALDGSASATLSISYEDEVVHKLEGKYLPEGTPYVEPFNDVIMSALPTDFAAGGYFTDPAGYLVEGNVYKVNFGGTIYECVARTVFMDGMSIGAAIGNGKLVSAVLGDNVLTADPFYLILFGDVMRAQGAIGYIAADELPENNEFSVTGYLKPHKINAYCLDNIVATKTELDEVTSNLATKTELDEVTSNLATKTELDEVKTSVSEGKALIASAVTDKGVATADDATFKQMAENISLIQVGSSGTTDAGLIDGTITKLVLPEYLRRIRAYAFADCRNLELTSLPSGVTSIGNNAFLNCTSIALTSLPSGVTSIGSGAFVNCTSIALTSLPSGITSIGDSAFSGCSKLALTSLPSGVTSIGNYAFRDCTSIALTSLPSGVRSIGNYAFSNCMSIRSISIPGSVTSIEIHAFRACNNLTEVTFEGTPTYINGITFEGSTNLTTINVPWAEGAVANAPWGATNATINYNYTGG